MESTFNFLNISINGFSWYEHIANQEDQTTADKKKKGNNNKSYHQLSTNGLIIDGHSRNQTLPLTDTFFKSCLCSYMTELTV